MILTPIQVQKKEEKLTQSSKYLSKIKSKFCLAFSQNQINNSKRNWKQMKNSISNISNEKNLISNVSIEELKNNNDILNLDNSYFDDESKEILTERTNLEKSNSGWSFFEKSSQLKYKSYDSVKDKEDNNKLLLNEKKSIKDENNLEINTLFKNIRNQYSNENIDVEHKTDKMLKFCSLSNSFESNEENYKKESLNLFKTSSNEKFEISDTTKNNNIIPDTNLFNSNFFNPKVIKIIVRVL